jgi:hypothetical protein
MFFTFPEDARWNAERQAVEFGVEIGECHGVVRVPRRVFQRLLPESPTPERCVEAYYLQRTRFESIAERKLRRRSRLHRIFHNPLHRCWRPRRVVVSVRGEGETAMKNLNRPGTIVNARGREWIVLPSRKPEVLRLRLAATRQADEIGRDLPLEPERVWRGRFPDPDPVGGDVNGNITLFGPHAAAVVPRCGPSGWGGRSSSRPLS